MKLSRRRLLAAAAIPAFTVLPRLARAQGFPERTLRLVVGYAPGTAPDVLARLLAQRMGELLKQQVVVDNKAGAGGQIAAQMVAKAAPDGYTLLLGEVGSISIAPAAFSKLAYDPPRELAGISEVAQVDFLLTVPANAHYQTVAEFAAAMRAKPGKVNFGTFGAGTSGHFGAELLGEAAGFKVEPVHYRSTGDAISAILAGDVAAVFASTALGAAQIKGGKMRALATTAPQRSPLLPQVPTMAEAGYPKIDISSWFALMAPQGTPAAVLDMLNRQAAAAVQSPDTKARLVEAGFSVAGTSRADTDRMLRSEASRWAAVVKASGFRGD
ncbi:tripartite tricarboxylate transporter substrate binding protein [Ramlibacter sp. G-1-2-2]|uniref:Tripartite tricarboxylate transporter substrate binding protein n=1 Tax=Ramlibacter agri TaxID=2728837 RepID=A0A848H8T2_9BURK|nr:tripartite tricarboxylate transporter substrate-binding protein [Ramlibacter agri]NML47185.1 tripartite tricarboxylate transporter substrate binding protein [Ramlibacter agri]